MSKSNRSFWYFLLPVGIVATLLGLGLARSQFGPTPAHSKEKQDVPAKPQGDVLKGTPIVGTASCSARGCHGAIDPVVVADDNVPPRSRQIEYGEWARDPHANAYAVLFLPRSERMLEHLKWGTKAHEEKRCLACHTNPTIASMDKDDPFAQGEKLFGVGCESCHGNANDWLVDHTRANWRKQTSDAVKREKGMTLTKEKNLGERAAMCAGCHVGAPADNGLPVRDMNHDLIAAGHPRLNFEFNAFQANMPQHWQTQDSSDAHVWAVGQIASAEAALKLLIHRANPDTKEKRDFDNPIWPEFAEYDCFACHHSLADQKSRQQPGARNRKPGTLPWGSWYFALTRPLAGPTPALDALETEMQRPAPNRVEVLKHARLALHELKALQTKLANPKDAELLTRQRIVDRYKTANLVEARWDGVEQLYLALFALQPSPKLHDLANERAFSIGLSGPNSFALKDRPPFEPSVFLKKLKEQ